MQASNDNGVKVEAGNNDVSTTDKPVSSIINFDQISKKEMVETVEKTAGKPISAMSDDELSGVIQKLTSTAGTPLPDESKATQSAPDSDEEEVVLRVKKSDLGTYATGRSTVDAVREKLRGKDEADKTIEFFKNEKLPRLESRAISAENQAATFVSENKSLKNQIQEYEARLKNLSGDSGIELPEEIDFFDPDHQELTKKVLEDYRSKRLASKNVQPQPQKTEPEAKPPAAPDNPTQSEKPQQDEAKEFDDLRNLQRNPDYSEFFQTKTDIQALNNSYLQFTIDLAKTCGIQNPYDANGQLTPETRSVLADYFEPKSTRGDRIRTAANRESVAPPEELPALQRVLLYHQVRSTMGTRRPDGTMAPLSESDAVNLLRVKYPNLFETKKNPVNTRIDEIDARSRAIEDRKARAVEVPTSAGADVTDLNAMPLSEFNRLMKKPRAQYTPAEQTLMKKLLMEKAGYTEKEATDYLTPKMF
jgi:hypothetical protein